ncbi:MAG: hypothetical protein ACOYJG_03050 [Prevotella sp.]|jgi:hypothetical protein
MKRYKYLLIMLIAACGMTFVSCDDDDWYDDWYWGNYWDDGPDRPNDDDEEIDFVRMAQTLAGDWHGTTKATYQDENGQWQTVEYYTEINFTLASQTNATFGNGLQNDFEGDSLQATYSRQFTWYIDTQDNLGDIIIEYIDPENVSNKYMMIISYDDLHLDERSFTGKLVAVDNTESDEFDWSYMSNAKNITITFEGEQ